MDGITTITTTTTPSIPLDCFPNLQEIPESAFECLAPRLQPLG